MNTLKIGRIMFMMLAAFSLASCNSDEPQWADPEAHEKTEQLLFYFILPHLLAGTSPFSIAKIVELGAETFTLCEKFTVYNYSCYTYGVAPAGKML